MEEKIMTLLKWKPLETNLPGFFTNYVDNFLGRDILSNELTRSVPPVNISEKETEWTMELAIPGLEKKDFKVTCEQNILTVSTEKSAETKEDSNGYSRREFNYNSFSRSFTLPETINVEGISAEYNNGVLTVHLPKNEEAKRNGLKEIRIS